MYNLNRTIIVILILSSLMISCLTQIRTRQFIVDSEKSPKKFNIGDWVIFAPELKSFYKQAGVGKTPGFDTTLFIPFLKVKKPTHPTNFGHDIFIDSIIITFDNTKEQFIRFSSLLNPLYRNDLDTTKYKYFYFDSHNSINIPMGVDSILFEFEAIIKDSKDKLISSKRINYHMIRHEKKRIGVTYGD